MKKDCLRLEAAPEAQLDDNETWRELHVYTSSVRDDENNQPLLSILGVGQGRGMRLTVDQVQDLRKRLKKFVHEAKSG